MNAPQQLQIDPSSQRFHLYLQNPEEHAVSKGEDQLPVTQSGPVTIHLNGEEELPKEASQWRTDHRVDIHFPTYQDGRGYSLAQRLREIEHFQGEICASGDIRPDQLHYLLRSGFNAVVVSDPDQVEQFEIELKRFGVFYIGVEGMKWAPELVVVDADRSRVE